MEAAIAIEHLSKRYGDYLALDDVSLEIPRGEVCGFLGPNGAGKTTTIRILFDLIRPTSGSARVMGIDCQSQGLQARAHMAYLPGDVHLYDSYTAQELIDLFASIRGDGSSLAWRKLCERLRLDPIQRMASYSKGNRQKVGLVLAFMQPADVLILDEPTSGLDPLVQEEVERMIDELAQAGKTVFFSSHALSEVERVCHRVAILRRGRLVAVEDVANLKGHSLHFVEVTFLGNVPSNAFSVPGVSIVRRDGQVVRFQVQSNLDALIKGLARYQVVDLRTEQPSLEDVFLTYYQDTPGKREEAGTDVAI